MKANQTCGQCWHPHAAHDATGCDMCIIQTRNLPHYRHRRVCTLMFGPWVKLPGRTCWVCGRAGIRGFARDVDGRDICFNSEECAYRFNIQVRRALA